MIYSEFDSSLCYFGNILLIVIIHKNKREAYFNLKKI